MWVLREALGKRPLAYWGEEGVVKGAVFDHVAAARDGGEIFGQADARFLDVALFAGDGDTVFAVVGIGFEESLFDQRSWQAHGFVQFAENLWAVDGAVGFARQRVIGAGREARAGAVFLPLVPCKAGGAHDVGHLVGLAARGVAFYRAAVAGPALVKLRPEPVQNPAVIFASVALGRVFRIAFQFAPIGGPAEGHDIVIKFSGWFAFGCGLLGK